MTAIAVSSAQAVGIPNSVRDGVALLDLLLSELNPHDSGLLDAALDLREAVARGDAPASLELLFRIRTLLGSRHRSTFCRVQCWMLAAITVQVRANRALPWIARAFPQGAVRLEEVVNASLATLAENDQIPLCTQVRFVFSMGNCG